MCIYICINIHPYSAVIRGEPGEDAVLCTETMTYELRAADTSNTLLLIPSLTYTQEEGGRRKGVGRKEGREGRREGLRERGKSERTRGRGTGRGRGRGRRERSRE